MRRLAYQFKLRTVGRSSADVHQDLRSHDRLDVQSLDQLRAARAAAHARFAMEHSPFYRQFYSSAGFTVDDLRDPSAFAELPLIDKQLIRDNFDSIRTSEATETNSSVSKTGGSTGLPLRVLRDERFPARALEWRLFDWWGVNPWDDRGIITRHMLNGFTKIRHDLQWLPSRRVELDAFRIDDDSVTAFVRRWNGLRPPFLLGYGGGVLDMARRLDRLGLEFAPPKAIAVTAAPLTPGVRAEIESRLGAPCYDHYRSAEVPWIGGECAQRDGLHVFADVRHVEILDDEDRPVDADIEGNVVVSDLTNRVFPIIRYRLGDLSSLRRGSCACGRPYPRLGPISGRASDAVRLPDGTTIAGALGHIFDSAPLAVGQFEIVQDEDFSVTLRCVPGSVTPEAVDAGISAAEQLLQRATRGLVPVAVERVTSIPQVGGKMRFIRSSAPAPTRTPTSGESGAQPA